MKCAAFGFFVITALPAMAQQIQPFLFSAANSASYSTNIAQGSMFIVYGASIGPTQLVQAGSYPLMNQIAGTSINVISGTTTLPCPMIYSSTGVAAAVMPSNTPAGTAMLTLTYNGQTTPFPVTIHVVASGVGIYTLGSSGLGPGVFTSLDGSVKTFTASAKTGETITIWATGLGPISGPDNAVPSTFPNFPGVTVFVGTQTANIIYAGRSGCCAGLDQISFQVPAGITGCYVPVAVSTAGGALSNFVSLPVNGGGGTCSDVGPTVPASVLTQASAGKPLKAAALAVGGIEELLGLGFDTRQYVADAISRIMHVKVSPQDVARMLAAVQTNNQRAMTRAMSKYAAAWKTLSPAAKAAVAAALSPNQEGAVAAFGQFNSATTLAGAVGGQFPSQGTCTGVGAVPFGSSGTGLNAGSSVALTGPAGALSLTPTRIGQYQVLFPSTISGPSLPHGTYTMTGSGGPDLPAFGASLSIASSLAWTNKATISTVDRTQPLTVTWSGAATPGAVLIGGYVSSNTSGIIAFACTEDATKGTFTIPSFILSLLPAAKNGGGIFISPHPLSHPITIPGFDLAYFMDGTKDSKPVIFQ